MKIQKAYSFDDLLMVDKFSDIDSRKDVDPSVRLFGTKLPTPVISSNMACVTNSDMASAMYLAGGLGCLHRFWSIEDNVESFKKSPRETITSVGLGDNELQRAEALFKNGSNRILIDVAQGASMGVINQVKKIKELVKDNCSIIVGNFSNANALKTFLNKLPFSIEGVKIGIGGGSACLTRVVSGCGVPTLNSIFDCAILDVPLIADGGIRNSGDLAKALAAGATAVMCGGLFAACNESLAEVKFDELSSTGPQTKDGIHFFTHKWYSGSASQESYEKQGKEAEWRTPEGDSYWIPATGSVAGVLQKLNSGLRTAMAYNNAKTVIDLQKHVEWIEVTSNGVKESGAHGNK